MASPATCRKCGSVLAGYERSKELNVEVYFCHKCRAEEEAAKKVEAVKEAA
ncbi:MAG: hypothetical protein ACE5G5_14150 [Candidatus Methylomirabilales bacterium]